jgi:predicted nucleic acid-binding protein
VSNGFLLDTNIPSELAKPAPEPRVTAWVAAQENLHLSVISIGEMREGLALLPPSKRRKELEGWFDRFLPMLTGRIVPVTHATASRWGTISAERRLKGRPLATADGLIAATALEHNLAVVTRNVKDFVGLGLTIVNPWDL